MSQTQNSSAAERQLIPLTMIQDAQAHVYEAAIRTTTLRLNYDRPSFEVYLKLENLQPIGSFKILLN